MTNQNCQIHCLELMSEGKIQIVPASLRGRLRLILHRRLPYRTKQGLKRFADRLASWFPTVTSGSEASFAPDTCFHRFSQEASVQGRDHLDLREAFSYCLHANPTCHGNDNVSLADEVFRRLNEFPLTLSLDGCFSDFY